MSALSGGKKNIVISVDLMGGDHAPEVPLKAVAEILHDHQDVEILAFGLEDKTAEALKRINIQSQRFSFIPSKTSVASEEKPSVALRKHKHTTMSDAILAVATNKASAVVSAGNTGAFMAIALHLLKVLDGIDRPAVLALIPTEHGKACLLDVGANATCQPHNLKDFAYLGSKFAQILLQKQIPMVGLLNIGTESNKGNDLIQKTHALLQDSALHYIGFVEANTLLHGSTDVIITDGFTGNVALKAMEGAGRFCINVLKEVGSKSLLAKLCLLMLKIFGTSAMRNLDPCTYNGGMLIGLNGIAIKSHGAANVKAFKSSVNHAIQLVKSDVMTQLKNMDNKSDD